MTFSERHFPASLPGGSDIPYGVRLALLTYFDHNFSATPEVLTTRLQQREGYGKIGEFCDDIGHRFGQQAADKFLAAVKDGLEGRHGDSASLTILQAIPAPMFLDVIEDLIDVARDSSTYSIIQDVNRLFTRRGIVYRINDYGRAEWVDEPEIRAGIVQPALAALVDARLQGARSEFEAALSHLRSGTEKDLEDAIEEAAKSVESVMKVLLDERGVQRNGRETTSPLFDKLWRNGIVVQEADNAVLGASRLRNGYGGHGSGAQVRTIPDGLSALTVRSAATAITFLYEYLP